MPCSQTQPIAMACPDVTMRRLRPSCGGHCSSSVGHRGGADRRLGAVWFVVVCAGMMFVKPTPLKRMTSRVVVDDNGGLVDLDNLDTSGIPIVPELDVSAMARAGPQLKASPPADGHSHSSCHSSDHTSHSWEPG